MKIDLHTHILPRDRPDLDALGSACAARVGLDALAGTNFMAAPDPGYLLVTRHSSLVTSFE